MFMVCLLRVGQLIKPLQFAQNPTTNIWWRRDSNLRILTAESRVLNLLVNAGFQLSLAAPTQPCRVGGKVFAKNVGCHL